MFPDCNSTQRVVSFVRKDQKAQKKKKRPPVCFWGQADDWKILMDSIQHQYKVPPEIAATTLRPDMCVCTAQRRRKSVS